LLKLNTFHRSKFETMSVDTKKPVPADEEKSVSMPSDTENGIADPPADGDELAGSRTKEAETLAAAAPEFDWETDPHNPYNWPSWKKFLQILMISAAAFTA
jgi:hypothetical protein